MGKATLAGLKQMPGYSTARGSSECIPAWRGLTPLAMNPLYTTSRIVAGAPIEGGIYRCALKPVDQALADGTYAPWMPNAAEIARLKQIFPSGVCHRSKPDQARP